MKTRLARAVGRGMATALYRAFVLDFMETLLKTGRRLTVFFHPGEERLAVEGWLGKDAELCPQEGDGLGSRMDRAFCQSFDDGAGRVLAVGGDTPDLPGSLLEEAFHVLGEFPAVIVPALDGGYAAIGFTSEGYCPDAFRGIAWGTSLVLEQTLEAFSREGARFALLGPWPDVDTPGDLDALETRLEASGRCPRVRAVLERGVDK